MNLIGRICPLLVCSILAAQQQPAAAPQPVPAQTPPAQPQNPPAPAQEPENIENMFSVGLFDWIPSGGPSLHAGTQAVLPPPHELTLPTKPYRAYGVMVTIPTKGSTRLEVSYLTVNDRGSAPAPTDLGLFGGTIAQGEPLSMAYSLRHLKLSWNYLSYPNPPDSKFRIKTLWEFHYIQFKPSVTATVTAPDQPLAGSQRILLPAVGLGMEYVMSRRFRLELRGSGMKFPHRSTIADAEGNAVIRVRSLEIFAGGKYLHFKTTSNSDTYSSGTLWGPEAGVRWVFR